MKIKKKLKLELFFETRHMLYCITHKQLYRLVKKKKKKKKEKQQHIFFTAKLKSRRGNCMFD